jgi:hypothetical protein
MPSILTDRDRKPVACRRCDRHGRFGEGGRGIVSTVRNNEECAA